MVPGRLVPNNGYPIDWSLWTYSPKPIRYPWTDGPKKFGPHGQMVPNQFGPPRQMVPKIFRLSDCGDPEIRGINFMGIVCPGTGSSGIKCVRDQMRHSPQLEGSELVRILAIKGNTHNNGTLRSDKI